VLTITKLGGAEYLLSQVAQGVEDYFMGAGEAPGVWHGGWADDLGLDGVVVADDLRALINGNDPSTGAALASGFKPTTVKAYDLTMSAPKSVSLLWAFGGDEIAAQVSLALVDASTVAFDFMERHAAVTRQQVHGVRRRVGTHGFAGAMFTHRTSRDGDPQLHVHCLVPNVVRRADGTFVAVDAHPLHVWLKAGGTIFQNELQRELTERLGVQWGPERNGCREIIGFDREQLRTFSKRTVAIETVLEAGDEAILTKAERMQADDRASLRTRPKKDKTLTPDRLWQRWQDEADTIGLPTRKNLERTVCHQPTRSDTLTRDQLFGLLVDPEVGLCATDARFGHSQVVTRIAALSAGRLTVTEIETLAQEFLSSDLVVRLSPSTAVGQRRPPQWSTVEHRRLEDAVLAGLRVLRHRRDIGIDGSVVRDTVDRAPVALGEDQARAVGALSAPGPAVRLVLAPAGHGKTALTATATTAAHIDGRPVVALAATNKAVGELRAAGVDAMTIARFRHDGAHLAAGSVVVVDEVSQVATRDAHVILDAVRATPGAMLWCLGDDRQGQPVPPGGLAAELASQAKRLEVESAELTVNRRQRDLAEQHALTVFRSGDVAESQTIRSAQGWEHQHDTPAAARAALAAAAVADADRYGTDQVAVLAVSHADCEDLADRIRAIRIARGELSGPSLEGPGWGPTVRRYAAGDRILLHTNLALGGQRYANGTTATVVTVNHAGLVARTDDGQRLTLLAEFVAGSQPDGAPNVSHAWARTIASAQGGTWEQVHLLATPTLDRNSAYVGQSRGRQPTHTWNTAIDDLYEHGYVLRDEREPAQQALDAMRREPDTTFSAADDPWVVDREMRAERAEHEQVLAAGPRDVRAHLDRALKRLERAERICADLDQRLEHHERQIAATGGIRTLRSATRYEHKAALAARDAVARDLAAHRAELAAVQPTVDMLHAADRCRRQWEHANQWHHREIGRIDRQLAEHWTNVVLAAVHQGEPLAYGLGRLRDARRYVSGCVSVDGTRDAQQDLSVLDEVLADLRVARVETIERSGTAPAHLVDRLGALPRRGPGRDAWCGLALLLEEQADRSIRIAADAARLDSAIDRLVRRHTVDPLEHPEMIVDHACRSSVPPSEFPGAERWQATVERATSALQAQLVAERDHGRGLSL
jgi:conjugative relaxase-like TrwC/TraI family protein